MDQDACTWYGARPQPRRLCVRWRPPLPPQKRGRAPLPNVSAHFYCGQTAACIKMPLGMEVGLSPGDFVLDGDPKFSAHVYLWSPYVIRQTIYIFILFMVALWNRADHYVFMLFMVALCNRADHYIFMLWFVLLLLLLSFFSSPNLSRSRLDVCHTSTHGVALVRI